MPNLLCPSVIATERFTQWLAPYGIAKLDEAVHSFPVHCIICHRLLIANCILPLTLSSYLAGLIHFTKICDDYKIPEEDWMPASEFLLSMFITVHGSSTVGDST